MMNNWDYNEANGLVPYHGCLKRRYPPLQHAVPYADHDPLRGRTAETGITYRIALRRRYLKVSGYIGRLWLPLVFLAVSADGRLNYASAPTHNPDNTLWRGARTHTS